MIHLRVVTFISTCILLNIYIIIYTYNELLWEQTDSDITVECLIMSCRFEISSRVFIVVSDLF